MYNVPQAMIGQDLILNGRSLLDSCGMIANRNAAAPGGNIVYEKYDVIGKDGDTYIRRRKRSDKPISFTLSYRTRGDWRDKITMIRHWIEDGESNKLTMSKRPDYYRKVKKIELTEQEPESSYAGQVDITFTVDPYEYMEIGEHFLHDDLSPKIIAGSNGKAILTQTGYALLTEEFKIPDGENPISNNSFWKRGKEIQYMKNIPGGIQIENPYAMCQPIYRVDGTGELTFNGVPITITCPTVIIDTSRMVAYNNGILLNGYIDGNYEDMWLIHGTTKILIPLGMSLQIIPNWREY